MIFSSKFYKMPILLISIYMSNICVADIPSFPLMSNLKNSSEYFVGREEFLKKMHEFLFDKSNNYSLVVSGSAGVGKTQVITRYAELHKTSYDIIWWFDFNKDLGEQYKNFAMKWNKAINKYYKDVSEQNFLHINTESTSNAHIQDEVHDRLRNTKLNWLIILDNSKDSIITLRNMPKHDHKGYGHIIVSTQNSAHHPNVMHLDKLSREESVELLLRITGENDSKNANLLADTLKDYPLAVSRAGSFIASYSTIDIEEYNRLFLTKRQELWDAENKLRLQRAEFDSYKSTVFTTLSVIINEMKKESLLAYELLAISAFLDNENIPENLLAQYVKIEHGPSFGDLEFKNALAVLMKYSLLNRNYLNKNQKPKLNEQVDQELLLSTHALIQFVMQDLLNEGEKKTYLHKAILATNHLLPNNIYSLTDTLTESFYLSSHIASLNKYATDFKVYNNDVMQLTLRALEYNLSSLGNNQDAEILISKVDEINKKLPDQENLLNLRFALMKSAFFGGKGNYPDSLKEALRAYEISKALPDTQPEEKLMIYNRLSRLYNVMGNNKEAFKYAELGREIVDSNKNLTGYREDFYRILVKIYVDDGDFIGALKYSETAATKLKPGQRSSLSDISAHLVNSDILIRLNKLKEAEQKLDLLAQVIAISLPKEHLYQANVIAYRSYVKAMLGKIKINQAIQEILSSQAMYKKLLKDEGYYKNRHTFMSHRFLGEVYEKQGNNIKAEQEYTTALKIITNIYEKSNAKTDDLSDFYTKLAKINVKLQRPEKALEIYRIHQQVFGQQHPRSLELMEYFADNKVNVGM
jgi:hypothetical protein